MKTTTKTSLLMIALIGLGAALFLGCHAMKSGRAPDAEVMYEYQAAQTYDPSAPPVDSTVNPEHNTETYDHIIDNAFQLVADHPLSTFSSDVDTASYANIRRFLTHNQLPPPGAVRIEEMINYFTYAYDQPASQSPHPFAVHTQAASCPWEPKHRLVRIALKARQLDPTKRPKSNLVFLLDVSGSMGSPNKLPLVKSAMKMLVEQLGENDRVAIAVYAGAAGLVLESTSCDQKEKIISALDNLNSGGSTNGGAGIELAYSEATSNFIKGGTNRVILATDGDFNIGTTNNSELTRLIEKKASSGVYLSILGFGMGNYKDSRMEELSGKGNGNYAYIDTEAEAKKVLVREMCGTLVTVAKDVKIQVEFNPAQVAAYRLIGYENRMLNKEDFNDDKKDAGDIGAGHTVTALYQVVPVGVKIDLPSVDKLKYSRTATPTASPASDEMMTVKLRYKKPDGKTSTRMDVIVRDDQRSIDKCSKDFRFASSVASFGMILRKSQYKGSYTLGAVIEMASSARGDDKEGYRKEFVKLVKIARDLKNAEK
ncbi:MAG: VWA domain-containing protein [Phycisphaerales bacterium]|jgi:Ca-activated chloride channel homolog|nr:VWA domain-containing protein [Phycisphaerales bacterium]